MKWYWPAIILTMAVVGALWPSLAGAQGTTVRVTSNAAYPILIDGEEATLPVTVPVGSLACIITNPGDISGTERRSFQGWSHGPTDECVTFDEPGNYIALYGTEYLLTILSEVRSFREIKWVPKGPTLLTVPELVEERSGVRYLFDEWSGGEARFSPQNRIVVNGPLTVTITWSKEYFLELNGPEGVSLVGQGWHKAKQNVVLKADATGESPEEDQRLQFKRWEVTSNPAVIIPNRQQPLTTISRIDDTHTIQAVYDVTFRVKIETDLSNTTEWLAQGKKVEFETPTPIDKDPGKERLSFKEWEGIDVDTPRASVFVDGPLNIKALYDREYKVDAEAPYGVTGDSWYMEGEVATIKVPEKPSAIFFLNRSFNGFDGYPNEGPILNLPVTGPLSVTATYQTKVNWAWIIAAIAILAVVGAVYYFSQKEYNRRRRRSRW